MVLAHFGTKERDQKEMPEKRGDDSAYYWPSSELEILKNQNFICNINITNDLYHFRHIELQILFIIMN